eukprot:CAMPEP_0197528992 /NCGR_PEP_ID=MMETSP1318-20131121/26992_1 /TAXON_ID=552666 /ORGANISM="Partenskyella glossopodia, Strain RCC365" /LENGTH=217 /DNA_ID=CAMNT_0043084307 /DNA_START=298 /DNA_END=951 /DNA_ORIENTATION=+
MVALTIDDAPSRDSELFSKLLDILHRNSVQATFFIISSHIKSKKHEELLRRAVRDGHLLANHMVVDEATHRYSESDFSHHLLTCQQAIEKFQAAAANDNSSGSEVKFFRAPHARMSSGMRKILNQNGYTSVLADAYTFDPAIEDAKFHKEKLLELTNPGSILLVHSPERNLRVQSLEILDGLIPKLKQRGFKLVTLQTMHTAAAADSKRFRERAART